MANNSLTVFYSTKKDNSKTFYHIDSKCALDETEIVQFVNPNSFSLSEAYNIAISECESDYLMLIHDDVLLQNGFDKIIMDNFTKYPEYGILGVAGTQKLNTSCIWWENKHLLSGQVKHQQKVGKTIKTHINKYSSKYENHIMDCVAIDGVLMAINLKKIKQTFNEDFEGFHFYDIPFCIENYLSDVKIGVMSNLLITHKSIGKLTDSWYISQKKAQSKYSDELPIQLNETKVLYDTYGLHFKEQPKIALVILSKDNVNMLTDCVNSIKTQSNYKNFNIHIGDTGSNDDNKNFIKNNLLNENVKLIELDDYNFAKNNNQIVNGLPDDVEYILFCNDDVKLINDAISHMMFTYIEKSQKNDVGTIGARLHYENGKIQHGGIVLYKRENKQLGLSHIGINTFYNAENTIAKVIGNTGAFMLIKKCDFLDVGGFNEKTSECFEDLLLNLELIKAGKINYFDGESVAYHLESVTRNKDNDKMKRMSVDYNTILIPYVNTNYNILKEYIK
jgi:GT2 family glycosyltransferase